MLLGDVVSNTVSRCRIGLHLTKLSNHCRVRLRLCLLGGPQYGGERLLVGIGAYGGFSAGGGRRGTQAVNWRLGGFHLRGQPLFHLFLGVLSDSRHLDGLLLWRLRRLLLLLLGCFSLLTGHFLLNALRECLLDLWMRRFQRLVELGLDLSLSVLQGLLCLERLRDAGLLCVLFLTALLRFVLLVLLSKSLRDLGAVHLFLDQLVLVLD